MSADLACNERGIPRSECPQFCLHGLGVSERPTRPETCREHLGRELGYCDGAIQTRDVNGRGFCVEHAKERGF